MKEISYDIATDLVPITLMARAPQLLAVHPAVPARSVISLAQGGDQLLGQNAAYDGRCVWHTNSS